MEFETKAQREIGGTTLCVTGLSFIMLSLFVFADKFDLSVILGTFIGSCASIFNYSLQVLVIRISTKCNSNKTKIMIWVLDVFRVIFIVSIAFIIFLVPLLHNLTGILALFFSQISRAIISQIRG